MSLSKSLLTLIILFITLITFTLSQDTTPPAKNIIGIDLGTTYSVVAIYRGGKVEIIPNNQGHRTTPSVVSYNQDGERLVGEAAKNNGPVNPKNTIYDVKRLIGRRYKEVLKKDSKLLSYRLVNQEGKVGIKVQRTEASPEEILSPEQVSAQILSQMKTTAEEYLGEEVTHAVITVPAYFNDQQRQATKDAGRIAGLNVVRIINEPTAASMAYGLDKEKEENILVFDLGGGTFDVTLLTIDHGVFEVIATSGDTHLGGEDFDLRIVEYMASLFKKKTGLDIMKDRRAFQRLKRACEDAKRALSSEVETRLEIDNIMNGKDFSEKLTRAKFEQLNMDLFKKTMNPVKQVLKDGGLNKNEVDEIVLVGGSTRIPKIRELLQQFFRGKPLHIDVNPDEAIAYGAAVQAAVIEGTMKQNVILIDVAPLSLGIETMGGRMSVIIPRNTPIPADKADTFTTTHDYQDRLVIPIYEGERPMTKFNRLLGEMELTGIQPAPKGVPQIKVSFQLDQNGILKVMAIDEATKKKNEITIQKGNPSQDEIEKMIEDAKKHEREDKDFVEGQKARNKLSEFTQFINKKMGEKEIKYKLKSGDRNSVVNAIKATMKFLRTVDAGTRKSEITREYRKLRNVVAPLLFGENGLISEDELRWDEEFDIETSSDDHWNDDSKEQTSQDDSNIDDSDQWNDDDQPISEAENVSEDESSIEVEEPKKDEL